MTAAGLKDLFERKRRAILRRPSFALSTGQARVRLRDGLCCDVEEAEWRTRIDQSVEAGGMGTAPHPAQVMRAAVGRRAWRWATGSGRRASMWRSTRSRSTCSARPTCAASSASRTSRSAGTGSLVDVCIASAAPEADVRRVVETADRLSPLLANLSPAIERVHRVRIVHPEEA